jgi:hypothetical protein
VRDWIYRVLLQYEMLRLRHFAARFDMAAFDVKRSSFDRLAFSQSSEM